MVKKLTSPMPRPLLPLKGGKFAASYPNSRTPITWKCGKCSHIWDQRLATVKYGSWCPKCAGNTRLSIEDARRTAEQKGGECLSDKYFNNHTLMEWKCGKCSYIWSADLNHVKDAGRWCPQCAGNLRLTLEEAQQIAKARGGKCLSIEYINVEEPMDWECGDCKSRWSTSFHSIKHMKTWCPNCRYKGETETRKIFEDVTSRMFHILEGYSQRTLFGILMGTATNWRLRLSFTGSSMTSIYPGSFTNIRELRDLKSSKLGTQ